MKFDDNFIAELGNSPKVVALVTSVTSEVARIVHSTAPVESGEYADTVREELVHTPYRAVGKVIADCDHGMLVESKYGTLARALNSVTGRG